MFGRWCGAHDGPMGAAVREVSRFKQVVMVLGLPLCNLPLLSLLRRGRPL